MDVRVRDDVGRSFRLAVRTDWWLAVDGVAGLAAYVVWVAGTAALGTQLATLADVPVTSAGTLTPPVLATVVLLWLVLPATVGVVRIRSRLLNIRGNVDQAYRLDRPAALLVPPATLIAVLLAPTVVAPSATSLLFVALVPVSLYLLVRTTAYSYRVFAFSHPALLHAATFVSLVAVAGVLLVSLGVATGADALVAGTLDAFGFPVDPLATVEVAWLAAPLGLAVAAALPIGMATAYLLVQTGAAILVHVRDPTVRPSRVRTGQRYPPGLDVAANGGGSRSGRASSGTGSSPRSAGRSGREESSEESRTGGDGPAPGDDSEGDDGARTGTGVRSSDGDDEEASVRHTRVFTPPDGSDDDPLSRSARDDAECPDCGAAVPADADRCPACGADAI